MGWDKAPLLAKDFRGYFWDFLRSWYLYSLGMVSTSLARTVFWLKGVDLNPGCKFYGVPIVRRFPLSRIRIGSGCEFRSDQSSNLIGVNHKCILATFAKGAFIEIADGCSFSGTVIGANERISLGRGVMCGANVLITDFDWHAIDPGLRRSGVAATKPVVLEANVWLGLNVVVLKGVRIGKNSVIGANSLVNSDIPANVIAAGNPCRVIRKI
jgi:acetyltransferase-like isoleucine patch superfamily enzyme